MAENVVERRVNLPAGVSASVDGGVVSVTGKDGKRASRQFRAAGVSVRRDGDCLVVAAGPVSRRSKALVGTVAAHLENLVGGLGKEFVYRMTVVYSHFPMNVSIKGQAVEINNFVGEKRMRVARILPNVNVSVKGKEVLVRSSDKDAAGQTAANIEGATVVRGKDKRIYQDGIFIVEKAVNGA